MFDALRTDLRFGLRQLVRAPVFTLVATVSIAVGIAVAVGAFSLLNAILFKPLPVPDASEIYRVYTSDLWELDEKYDASSYGDYLDFAASGAFTEMAAWARPKLVTFAFGSTPPDEQRIGFVSPNFFDVLRLPMLQGRSFTATDDDPAIVLSYPYWKRTFGPDENAIGAVVRANGVAFSVVGVAPAAFRGVAPDVPAVGWVSATHAPLVTGDAEILSDRSLRNVRHDFNIFGRLDRGTSPEVAASRLNALIPGLSKSNPQSWKAWNQPHTRSISILSYRASLAPPGQRSELVFVATLTAVFIALLLLLVCTNVAGLLMSRAVGRQHETAVRLSLGATRNRLLRQLLTESVLLSLLGGTLGFLATMWLSRLVPGVVSFTDALNLEPDWRVVLVAFGASLVCALFFGLTPALQSLRVDLRTALGNAAAAPRGHRLRGVLIAVQVAVSCVLIVLAVSMSRGVQGYRNIDVGIDTDGLLVAHLNTSGLSSDSVRAATFYHDLQEFLDNTAFIRSSARVVRIPFGNMVNSFRITLPGGVDANSQFNAVGNDYFETVGVRVLAGRVFDSSVRASSAPVAVVNQSFVRRFPQVQPGTSIDVGKTRGVHVIGVVGDIRYQSNNPVTGPLFYLSTAQPQQFMEANTVLIRVAGGTELDAARELQELMRVRFPDMSSPDIRSLRDVIADGALPQRFAAKGAVVTGVIELVLATVGLYGLLLVAMLSRTREIGVRLALGATAHSATWSVLKSGLRYGLIGGGAGMLIGLPAMMFAATTIEGARATDPVPFAAAVLALLVAIGLSAVMPAWRAAHIEPAVALRHDE
jgi:predicted permease